MENIWLITGVAVIQTTLPFLLILILGKRLLEKYWNSQVQKTIIDTQKAQSSEILNLKLGAFERLVLFLERNQVNELARSLAPKVNSAKELQYLMLNQIRSEYDHNLAQQVYVSTDLWKMISFGKDETIKIITLIGGKMDQDSTASDYAKELLDYIISSSDISPLEKALEALRTEVGSFIKR